MNTEEIEKQSQLDQLGVLAKQLRKALSAASLGLIERETLVELIALAAVAGEHILVVGPPGTAKSEAVRRVAQVLSGTYFEYLLGRFTEPSELFGPINLQKLREGRVEVETAGMLPEAEIAFLDEVFLGSTAILNTLLGILNEKTFKRGHTIIPCPLRVCVGASNDIPEEESLAAFADRFLVRVFVEPLPDSRIEDLLEGGWQLEKPKDQASVPLLDELTKAAKQVDVQAIRPLLGHAVRLLRNAGLPLSDRRVVKSQKLIAAAAVLAGRLQATEADLWPLIYILPRKESQELARDVLRSILVPSENQTLIAAAKEASLGPKARALSIVSRFTELLQKYPGQTISEEGSFNQFDQVASLVEKQGDSSSKENSEKRDSSSVAENIHKQAQFIAVEKKDESVEKSLGTEAVTNSSDDIVIIDRKEERREAETKNKESSKNLAGTLHPTSSFTQALHAWNLKVEAIAREMDAGFAKEELPEELKTIRQQIVALLQKEESGVR